MRRVAYVEKWMTVCGARKINIALRDRSVKLFLASAVLPSVVPIDKNSSGGAYEIVIINALQ